MSVQLDNIIKITVQKKLMSVSLCLVLQLNIRCRLRNVRFQYSIYFHFKFLTSLSYNLQYTGSKRLKISHRIEKQKHVSDLKNYFSPPKRTLTPNSCSEGNFTTGWENFFKLSYVSVTNHFQIL